MKTKTTISCAILSLALLLPSAPAHADFWGGDLAFLAQILAETIEQVAQLESILGTGKDSLNYMRDINQGIRDAMTLANTMNRTLKPGNWNLNNVNDILGQMQNMYGRIPTGSDSTLQSTNDMSVAESIQLHNDAFRYADQVDPEAERMKAYADSASPQGAAKASLQAQGVTIHVLNQLLRTNAALLKIQSESLAMQNRKSKLQSEQFRSQYGELSQSLANAHGGFDLPSLSVAQ
jgi:hypothetical protein